jgi:hypothetical protein
LKSSRSSAVARAFSSSRVFDGASYAPGNVRRAACALLQILVFENIEGFAIETIGMAVENFSVSRGSLGLAELRKIAMGRAFQECRTVGVLAVYVLQESEA